MECKGGGDSEGVSEGRNIEHRTEDRVEHRRIKNAETRRKAEKCREEKTESLKKLRAKGMLGKDRGFQRGSRTRTRLVDKRPLLAEF